MHSITGTNIKLTKGDSFYCQVNLTPRTVSRTPPPARRRDQVCDEKEIYSNRRSDRKDHSKGK